MVKIWQFSGKFDQHLSLYCGSIKPKFKTGPGYWSLWESCELRFPKFTDNFGTASSYLHFFPFFFPFFFYLCYYIKSTSAEVLEHAYLCFPVSLFFKFLNKSIRALIERLHEILQSPRKKGQDYRSKKIQRKLLCSLQQINGYKACIYSVCLHQENKNKHLRICQRGVMS